MGILSLPAVHQTPATLFGLTPAIAAEHSQPAVPKAEAAKEADEIWTDLMAGNARFVAGKPEPRQLIATREELAKGQHPKVIVLTCSDSRVCPETIFDKGLGEVFVVRTAGNVADPVALGSIEYAVEHLKAKMLVVLGHEKCGAVAAAASGEKMPSPNLEAIVSKITPALDTVKGASNKDELASMGIEANARQSGTDVVRNSKIVEEKLAAGELTLVEAVYHLKSGEVTRLK